MDPSQIRTAARFPDAPLGTGHYESFYLRAARPGGGMGVWIRYTIHRRPGAEATASLWLTLFDAEAAGPTAAEATFPASQLTFPVGGYVRIGHAVLEPGRAQGSVPLGSGTAMWDLRFGEGAPAFRHLPYDWLYRARVPRTKMLSPSPSTTFSGILNLDGREISVSEWPGMLGHNWGTEHAERWIWIDAVELSEPGAYLDLVAGKIGIRGRTTPWITNGVLSIDGQQLRLGGFGRIRQTRIVESGNGCEFTVAGAGVILRGRIASEPKHFVGWLYADPAGGEHNVINSSIADLELTVERRGGTRTLLARGSAVYELGGRASMPGIAMQPFADGADFEERL